MFFIGIFGIDSANKKIGNHNNANCPACGHMTHFEIIKSYSYLHIFFIPTFKWNIRYYLKTFCCDSFFELDPLIGQQFERGQKIEINNEHLKSIGRATPYKTCSDCGTRVDSGYRFCPGCGRRL